MEIKDLKCPFFILLNKKRGGCPFGRLNKVVKVVEVVSQTSTARRVHKVVIVIVGV